MGTPRAEVELDAKAVRALLVEQHPDLAELAITPLASGWDNLMFRLGEHLLLRFPRRTAAAHILLNEQRFLPTLAASLPVAVPAPLRTGVPGRGYPWHFSIVPWIDGEAADLSLPDRFQGETLAAFLKALHLAPPPEAPRNPYRGVPLQERRGKAEECMQRLRQRGRLPSARHLALWDQALMTPIDVDNRWIHGDLHPRNVIVASGRIVAIIDWGDIAQGDPACDLASVWTVLPDVSARECVMERYDASEATWIRARGWAFLFAMLLLDAGLADDQRMAVIAERILVRLTEGP